MGQVCCQNTRVEIPADIQKNNEERDTESNINYQEDKNILEQNFNLDHDAISPNNQPEHDYQFNNDYNFQQVQIEENPVPEIKSLKAQKKKQTLTPFSYVADQRGEDTKTVYIEQKAGWYKGQVVGQTPHGNGCFYFNDGSFYQGIFKHGIATKHGRLIFSNGNYYQGQIHDNQAHGEGIFQAEDYYYRGNWKHNKPDGQGFEKFSNDKYKGSFLQGYKHGKGYYQFSNGCIYQGDFFFNVIQGYGTLYYPEKKKHYTGQWKNGKMHGQGKFQWSSGARYEGTFVNNLFENDGKFYYKSGDIYQGNWRKGKKHGKGLCTTKNGQKFITEWQNGKLVE